ncbi:MAG TPA: sialidase family protein [Acidimicrobiales bacterium]
MHAKTLGRHRAATPAPQGASPRLPRLLLAAAAAGLLASACVSADAGPERASSTFTRAEGAALTFTEPLSRVADLVPPAEEGGVWTIVGSVFEPSSRVSVASVWTAEDARHWEREAVDPARVGTDERMVSAVHVDGGLLAVGQVGSGDHGDAAIWRLRDGDWAQDRPEVMGGDHEQWAFAAATGEGGTLVAGAENAWGEVRPRLWLSTDGETWRAVDGGAGGPLDATGTEVVRAVTALGEGFVAVGSRDVENEQDGVVWYSPDGETWEEVEAPELGGAGRQELLSVVATEAGLVAGGFSAHGDTGQGAPYIWRSPDARTWARANEPLPMTDRRHGASDLAVRSLTARADGALTAAGGSDWRPRVWASGDGGATWKELPNPVHGELFQDGLALRDAEAFGGVTVALAGEPAVLLLAGQRWQDATGDQFPKGGEQPFATSVAVGDEATIVAGGIYTAPSGKERESYRGQLWRRTRDGWKAIDSEALNAGHVMAARPFAGGFVAVGFEDFGLAEERSIIADGEPDGLVWMSRNGTDWGRIGVQDAELNLELLQFLDNPSADQAAAIAEMERSAPPLSVAPAGGAGTRSLGAVAPLGEGFIAVGSAYDRGNADPIVVVSKQTEQGLALAGEDAVASGPGLQRYNDVCVAPDGTALAVGIDGPTGAHEVIAGVRAPDGKWTRVEGPDSFTGGGSQQANACAAGEDGFVIVGSDDRSGTVDARVWTSEDGLAWTLVESSLLGGTGDQWATAVTAVPGGGWLVAGTDTVTGEGDIALWRIDPSGEDVSRRDRGERALGGPGEQSVTDLVITEDGRVTLVGNDYGRVGLWESDSLDR